MPRHVVNAVLFAAALAAALAVAGAASARSSDRNQPMDLDADRSDCSVEDEGGPCLFNGNVHIVQGTLDIRADSADVRRGGGEIRRVLLRGAPVVLRQQTDNGSMVHARATQVDYDMPSDIVVFTGSAHIEQPGRGSITGERIVYNMKTGQVQSGGAGAGRVKMRILPKNAPNTQGRN
jgi:lipopolysaccharide export system protein LptA